MYHAARTTTCRLCEYQCYVAGNNALHSIAVDSAWWLNAACQATIVNNSRSGAQGISTNVALLAGGCCYETMLLPRTSKQGKEKTLKVVAFGPSALRQQFSMSSLSPVLRYVIIIHYHNHHVLSLPVIIIFHRHDLKCIISSPLDPTIWTSYIYTFVSS